MTGKTLRSYLSASLPTQSEQMTRAMLAVALVICSVGFVSAVFSSSQLVLANAQETANLAAKLKQQQTKSTATTSEPNAAQLGSVSLKAILEHQNALQMQCAKLEQQTRRQLAALSEFDQSHEFVQLPRPLPVKMPAVCLLLRESLEQQPKQRLQMVNWIFAEDEWLTRTTTPPGNRSSGEQVVVKRHASSLAPDEIGLLDPSDSLLGNYLFDTSVANQAPIRTSQMDAETLGQVVQDDETSGQSFMRHQLDSMLADEKFQNAIGSAREKIGAKLSPVVLVPGLLGSRLQARVNKEHRVNIFCSKETDWQDLWLSLRAFLPWAVDCWLDNARLEFDPETGFTKEPEGVESRVPDFGSVESVRHLDLRSPTLTGYFEPLIKRYEQLGYTADENLLAAPYDFRLAPQQLFDTYYVQLRQLIERAQARSPTRRSVTLVCHSMGCTHLLAFLRLQSPAWRQKRIRKVIAIGSPWAGSGKSLKALLVGDLLDLPLVSAMKMRKLARTFPGISFLLPQASYFSAPTNGLYPTGSMGPNLVETPERVYNVNQMQELLRDLNLTTQWNWFEQTTKLIDPKEPLVDVHMDCIHSLNIPTPLTLRFNKIQDLPDGDYKLITGDGDGTVNYESLMVCSDWAQKLPDKVKHKIILNANHIALLSHKKLLDHLTDDVLING